MVAVEIIVDLFLKYIMVGILVHLCAIASEEPFVVYTSTLLTG
jgi:hypothetical protein